MSNLKQFESREAVSPSPLDMTDSLSGQSGIGDSKKIATKDPDRIRILYEAKFRQTCWDSKSTMKRKYFYLLENGYETSNPYGLNCICFKIPGNVCCPGYDSITKMYFDRGVFGTNWQEANCWYFSGEPMYRSKARKIVCCCLTCCECCHQCMDCYCPSCCGERVTVNSYDSYTWLNIPLIATYAHNNGELLGFKNGEHLCSGDQIVSGLIDGEAERLILAIKRARTDWLCRQCA